MPTILSNNHEKNVVWHTDNDLSLESWRDCFTVFSLSPEHNSSPLSLFLTPWVPAEAFMACAASQSRWMNCLIAQGMTKREGP